MFCKQYTINKFCDFVAAPSFARYCARMTARHAATVVLLLVTLGAAAEEPSIVRKGARALRDEAKRYVTDAAGIAVAPLHWDERTWKQVALLLAADAAAFAADEEIGDAVQRNRTPATDDISRLVTPLGGGRGLQIAAAAFLTGVVLKKPAVRDAGRDAVEASILASGVIAPAIKRVAGRSRPNAGEGAYAFDPFGHNESFPSGHATNAFALASVFAAHSNGRVVPTIAYTLASAVAVARVHDNVHYASDVLAGAAIGTAVGRSIVARHRRTAGAAAPRVTWAVVPVRGGVAFEVAVPAVTLSRLRARLVRVSVGSERGAWGQVETRK